MKKGQKKITSESKIKTVSKDKKVNQNTPSKSQSSKKVQKTQKGSSVSKTGNVSVSKSNINIQSGYSSISKDKKEKNEKIEKNLASKSLGRKMPDKSPKKTQNLSKRRNALKSASDISVVKKVGRNNKKEDEVKVKDVSKQEKKLADNVTKRGRSKQNEEEEKAEV
jgi:hypothetical protein